MNMIQKSEAIKNGLRKGFQDGRAFSPLPASPSGIVKQLTNCSPMDVVKYH